MTGNNLAVIIKRAIKPAIPGRMRTKRRTLKAWQKAV
jgi:hypothetical protein